MTIEDDVDLVGWTEHRLELRLQESSAVGRASAYEEMVIKLTREAGDKFAKGQDTIAHYIRDELIPMAQKSAVVHRDVQRSLQERMRVRKWID